MRCIMPPFRMAILEPVNHAPITRRELQRRLRFGNQALGFLHITRGTFKPVIELVDDEAEVLQFTSCDDAARRRIETVALQLAQRLHRIVLLALRIGVRVGGVQCLCTRLLRLLTQLEHALETKAKAHETFRVAFVMVPPSFVSAAYVSPKSVTSSGA